MDRYHTSIGLACCVGWDRLPVELILFRVWFRIFVVLGLVLEYCSFGFGSGLLLPATYSTLARCLVFAESKFCCVVFILIIS